MNAETQPIIIRCADACGRIVTAAGIEQVGWTFLAIARRWRCPACCRALAQANEPAPPAEAIKQVA